MFAAACLEDIDTSLRVSVLILADKETHHTAFPEFLKGFVCSMHILNTYIVYTYIYMYVYIECYAAPLGSIGNRAYSFWKYVHSS